LWKKPQYKWIWLANTDIVLSIFMSIDQARFDALSLSSILSTEKMLPCFLSAITTLEAPGLNVTVGDMSEPMLKGFASPGINLIASHLVHAAFAAYEPTLLRTMPCILPGAVHKILLTRILDKVLQYRDAAQCVDVILPPDENGEPAILDFRDLFLEPEEAKALGATGEQQYGDVGQLAYLGNDGLPNIYETLIRPFSTQSRVEGTIRLPARAHAVNYLAKLGGGLSLNLGDIRVSNLDAVVIAVELLNLTDSPSVLRNSININGYQEQPERDIPSHRRHGEYFERDRHQCFRRLPEPFR
jgi:hypothetical protein